MGAGRHGCSPQRAVKSSLPRCQARRRGHKPRRARRLPEPVPASSTLLSCRAPAWQSRRGLPAVMPPRGLSPARRGECAELRAVSCCSSSPPPISPSALFLPDDNLFLWLRTDAQRNSSSFHSSVSGTGNGAVIINHQEESLRPAVAAGGGWVCEGSSCSDGCPSLRPMRGTGCRAQQRESPGRS